MSKFRHKILFIFSILTQKFYLEKFLKQIFRKIKRTPLEESLFVFSQSLAASRVLQNRSRISLRTLNNSSRVFYQQEDLLLLVVRRIRAGL